MEVVIRDGSIVRVWIHFTVDALSRMEVKPEAYRAAADSRGIPVPDGWAEGTPSMLASAERTDRLADGGRTDAILLALYLVGTLLATVVGVVTIRTRRWNRLQQIVNRSPGTLLENLLRAHLAADARVHSHVQLGE